MVYAVAVPGRGNQGEWKPGGCYFDKGTVLGAQT